MNRYRWYAIVALAVFLTAVPVARAQQQQQNAPRIGYVYPAGGQQGTTFEVTVGGQFLNGVTKAHVSGTGVTATLGEVVKVMSRQEFNALRDQLDVLQARRMISRGLTPTSQPARKGTTRPAAPLTTQAATKPWTAADDQAIIEIRKKIATFIGRPMTPAISEQVIVRITMAGDAELGERDLRLETASGMTNPVRFRVGQLPEFSRKAAKVVGERPNMAPRFGMGAEANTDEEMSVTLPATVNGQITPGAVNRFGFTAHKGQRLVIAASARELIPYLADAVPGWFQASVSLFDAKGHELAFGDHFRFGPDPVLYCEIPQDGEYLVQIRDVIYRGREDFVYRISMGELPYVTSIFPLGGKAGEKTVVEAQGWNLQTTKLTQDNAGRKPGVYPVSMKQGQWTSNSMPFALDTLPECLDKEPNNSVETAQPLTLPVIVNGRIDKPGDWDVFRFDGKAGSEIVAEVYARRLDSPLDSVLKLTDASGKVLAFNDDHEDKGSGLNTHHADSWLRAKLPAEGTYYVHLGDVQNKGGPEFGYRLRVSEPRGDFELRMVPSCINIRSGTTVPVTVYALRKDGYSKEIALTLRDAPEGYALGGGIIPAGQDKVRITVTIPPKPLDEPVSLKMEGHATIQGREVSRPVVPAEDMMQAFAYWHLVPAKELVLTATSRWMPRGMGRVFTDGPVEIPAGGSAKVQIGIPTSMPAGRIRLELNEPPEGIAIRNVNAAKGGTEVVLQCDGAKAKAGLKGNLIFNVSIDRANQPASGPASGSARGSARGGNNRRAQLGTLSAIPFEVVAKQTAAPEAGTTAHPQGK